MRNNPPDPAALLGRQKQYFAARGPVDGKTRRQHLLQLEKAIKAHTPRLLRALQADLGKCETEAYASEIGLVLRDIRFARSRLQDWMRPVSKRVPLIIQPGHAFLQPVALGVVLILGPWNYPFQLLFSPLVSALAAGNVVCLKPSEWAPDTAEAVHTLCADAFEPDQVAVVTGDAETAASLTAMPFDHIFFTGSTATGRKVARAAAENLVPVTLELGGKSPCVVCADAPLERTAKRILWGKCLNAGQTCIAPDYVLAHTDIYEPLLRALAEASRTLVPARPPGARSADYGLIVNPGHFDRLLNLMQSSPVYHGGEYDRDSLTLAPALLIGVDWNHPVMQEEIFGPLLPVLEFKDWDEIPKRLNSLPKPLAAYLFTRNRTTIRDFEKHVACGSICINDTISQVIPADLPFGGVGASGYGQYHGKAGFDTFSQGKAILRRALWMDLPFRYPPFKTSLSLLKRATRLLLG